MMTPWGESNSDVEIGTGIVSITTPGHGGIMVSEPALSSIPQKVRNCMINQGNGRLWAEEDIEMRIVLAILLEAGKVDEYALAQEFPAAVARDENGQPEIRHTAQQICKHFERYTPCWEFLKEKVKP